MYDRISNDSEEKENEQKTDHSNKTKSDDIEEALIKLIVKERLPISKLDSVHLNNLIKGTFMVGLLLSNDNIYSNHCCYFNHNPF